ncbi:MAG: hypothetical protein NC307_05655 [Roseburia sp.]|nr:hypothetical protein [Roseburia sp.]
MGMSTDTLAQGTAAARKLEYASRRISPKKSEKKNSSGKKKKFAYNPREISGELLRTSKASGAAVVMVKAREKVAVLEQALSSGAYDEASVQRALVHAKKMVECSKMKLHHLRDEEQTRVKHQRERQGKDIQKKASLKRRIALKEQQLKQKKTLEESHDMLREKTRRQELGQKKRNHRREELEMITEAEMEYLKSQVQENSGSSFSDMAGVSLELSGSAVEMSELSMPGDTSAAMADVGTAVDVCV